MKVVKIERRGSQVFVARYSDEHDLITSEFLDASGEWVVSDAFIPLGENGFMHPLTNHSDAEQLVERERGIRLQTEANAR